MKIQRMGCKTCGAIFSVCRDESADSDWYKDVSRYLANGNSFIETIEHPKTGSAFGEKEISDCCGKKVKVKTNHPKRHL